MIMSGLRCSTFDDKVFATGKGWYPGVMACALPYKPALKKWVKLSLPNGNTVKVQVLDIGPYWWGDSNFIELGFRPYVEHLFQCKLPFPKEDDDVFPWSKIQFAGKVPASRASIDVTPDVWIALGIDKTYEELKTYSNDDVTMEWFV